MDSRITNVYDVIAVAQEIKKHCEQQGFWNNETFNVEVTKETEGLYFEYKGQIYETSYEVACQIKEDINLKR